MLGSIEGGIKNFTAALDLAQTELNCVDLFSLRDAAEAALRQMLFILSQ